MLHVRIVPRQGSGASAVRSRSAASGDRAPRCSAMPHVAGEQRAVDVASRRARPRRGRRGARRSSRRRRAWPGRSAHARSRASARWPPSARAAAGRSESAPASSSPTAAATSRIVSSSATTPPAASTAAAWYAAFDPGASRTGTAPIASAISARCAASSSSPSIAIVAPCERRERAVEVRERDQRVERAGLGPGRHRRLRAPPRRAARSCGSSPGPRTGGGRGERLDDVVRDGEDHELDVVDERVRLGERADARDALAEPLAARRVARRDGADRPARPRLSATPSAVPTAPAPTIPTTGRSPGPECACGCAWSLACSMSPWRWVVPGRRPGRRRLDRLAAGARPRGRIELDPVLLQVVERLLVRPRRGARPGAGATSSVSSQALIRGRRASARAGALYASTQRV